MIYLYLFGTCFHFIYVFMIIGNNLHMKYMKLFSPSIFLNRYLKIYKSR